MDRELEMRVTELLRLLRVRTRRIDLTGKADTDTVTIVFYAGDIRDILNVSADFVLDRITNRPIGQGVES